MQCVKFCPVSPVSRLTFSQKLANQSGYPAPSRGQFPVPEQWILILKCQLVGPFRTLVQNEIPQHLLAKIPTNVCSLRMNPTVLPTTDRHKTTTKKHKNQHKDCPCTAKRLNITRYSQLPHRDTKSPQTDLHRLQRHIEPPLGNITKRTHRSFYYQWHWDTSLCLSPQTTELTKKQKKTKHDSTSTCWATQGFTC